MMQAIIAAVAAFVLTLVIGRFLIPELHKLKAGQEIRADGPTWHKSKAGTPTMGGIMFILGAGVIVFILGWGNMLDGVFVHLYVYLFALIFGLIGFVDDYRKVRQHQNEGLTARQKFILQLAAAVVFLVLMRYEGLLTNDLRGLRHRGLRQRGEPDRRHRRAGCQRHLCGDGVLHRSRRPLEHLRHPGSVPGGYGGRAGGLLRL